MQPVARPISLIVLSLTLLFGGCGSKPVRSPDSGAPAAGHPRSVAGMATSASARKAVVGAALEMLGRPYRYGGTGAGGFDCSGLVWFTHQRAGIEVPRTAVQQMATATRVSSGQSSKGDLLFFRIDGSRNYHVAIYLGDGEFIHAPSSGKQVSLARLDQPYWKSRLLTAGNFYPGGE